MYLPDTTDSKRIAVLIGRIEAKGLGQEINEKKTKDAVTIKIENEEIEEVEEFYYLESMIDRNGEMRTDITRRITQAQKRFNMLR
ncbi:hypothetical protein ILUMI_00014 [Ignelater luminosus]|uniref:Reverse transcriptase domain-containing protein n=1 Tax=Ignelater luminosus TaxID=2038154 RepID=A0A8K0DMP9_IGNLU|nr:hypothetical protein ILUMI_00014 [Ignelater luminosus]